MMALTETSRLLDEGARLRPERSQVRETAGMRVTRRRGEDSAGGYRRAGLWLATLLAFAVALQGGVAVAAGRPSLASWSYLVEKLIADGVPRATVVRSFSDPRVPAFDGLPFALEPREPQSRYRQFLEPGSLARARRCRDRWWPEISRAGRSTNVSPEVIAAILHVETGCGGYTGNSVVLYRLARLAMAAEPANLARNVASHQRSNRDLSRREVARKTAARARYLEDNFYPEVRATFTMSSQLGIDPLAIRGSVAGAFGWPQFLPASYVRFGRDGNANARVSLFEPPDAMHSVAAYLAGHGWRPGLSHAARRRVIWHYNRSDAYIDTVLALADRLHRQP